MKCQAGNELLTSALPGAFVLLVVLWGPAQGAVVSVVPDADSFVRSAAPESNYGGAGALSVSGSAAVNEVGEQNGLFDTLMRFPLTNVVSSFGDTFGQQNWVITKVQLIVNESAAPMNSIFNRGVGPFEVLWQASDEWMEGTGRPNAPTSDGVTWQDLSEIVNSNLDTSLGVFTNTGADGPETFTLALADRFVADMRLGDEVTLRLTASSPAVGFTFTSRNFGNTNAQPVLEVTAVEEPRPQIESISFAGTNVLIQFEIISNWTYVLQGSENMKGGWSNLLTLPPQPANGHEMFVESATGGKRFYRLSLSP